MGIMDWVKGVFDKGGIKVRLSVPKDFRWGDDTIPVAVTLTGHKSEPRMLGSLGFIVEDVLGDGRQDNEAGSQSNFGRRVRIAWEREGVLELAPGQTMTLNVPVRLNTQEHEEAQQAVRESLEGTAVGGLLGAASKMGASFGAMTDPSQIRSYRITVLARADGAKNAATHSRQIRQGGAFKVMKPKLSL